MLKQKWFFLAIYLLFNKNNLQFKIAYERNLFFYNIAQFFFRDSVSYRYDCDPSSSFGNGDIVLNNIFGKNWKNEDLEDYDFEPQDQEKCLTIQEILGKIVNKGCFTDSDFDLLLLLKYLAYQSTFVSAILYEHYVYYKYFLVIIIIVILILLCKLYVKLGLISR